MRSKRCAVQNQGITLKILLYFVASLEVAFAVVAPFGCSNFVRNVVFHRPFLKGAFQRIKK